MSISVGRTEGEPMMEMNTTPLIDVMLVLIIMFIITIPIQTHAVKSDLPGSGDVATRQTLVNRLAIDASGTIRWNGAAIALPTLRTYLRQSMQLPMEPELQFRPDAETRYAVVDEVMAEIRRAGVTRMGFVGNERYANY